jgi:hypothetical protein
VLWRLYRSRQELPESVDHRRRIGTFGAVDEILDDEERTPRKDCVPSSSTASRFGVIGEQQTPSGEG